MKMSNIMSTRWYKRSGMKVSEAAVRKSQMNYVKGKRTGNLGGLRCSINPDVADRVEAMSLKEFASWSGQFVWRDYRPRGKTEGER